VGQQYEQLGILESRSLGPALNEHELNINN
jgi:hypothetical protein